MNIITLGEIDSTNTYAKNNIDTLKDRDVVHALRQTAGRGRLNRSFVDLGENNLFFSIVLKPSQDFRSVYANITQYSCLILCKIFENYGLNAKIKWPNDVMIDGKRKISGILSETVMENNKLKGLIIGIGVNLNADKVSVEAIQGRVVTALNLEIGRAVNPDSFLNEFFEMFFKDYDKLLKCRFELIKSDYVSRNCFLNKDLSVQVLDSVKAGYAKDINNTGELVLVTPENKELVLNIGDIL